MPTKAPPARLKVLLVDEDPDRALRLRGSLEQQGCEVVSTLTSPLDIYEAVGERAPDVIIIETESPSRDSLESLAFVSSERPRPIVMFTGDRSSVSIRSALAAGVSAYVVDGLSPERLLPILDVAVERFAADQSIRRELSTTRQALADRKVIERAKGVLMKRRTLDEESAFRELRRFAMDRGISLADAASRVVDLESLV